MAAIASGAGVFEEVREAFTDAWAERDAAMAELSGEDALPVVALHPTIAPDYRRQVAKLQCALAEPETKVQAVPALRSLIDRIVLTPKLAGRGVTIEVEGRLASIVALATGAEPPT